MIGSKLNLARGVVVFLSSSILDVYEFKYLVENKTTGYFLRQGTRYYPNSLT